MARPPQSLALSCWLGRGNLMEHPCCPLTACRCSHHHPRQSAHGYVSCGPEQKVRWDERSREMKSLVRQKVRWEEKSGHGTKLLLLNLHLGVVAKVVQILAVKRVRLKQWLMAPAASPTRRCLITFWWSSAMICSFGNCCWNFVTLAVHESWMCDQTFPFREKFEFIQEKTKKIVLNMESISLWHIRYM